MTSSTFKFPLRRYVLEVPFDLILQKNEALFGQRDVNVLELCEFDVTIFDGPLFLHFICTIFTGRNEVLAKVIFSQASVIHSVHGGGCLQIWGGVSGPGGCLQIFGGGGSSTAEYGQRSAGTHPTGMHSCILFYCYGNCIH